MRRSEHYEFAGDLLWKARRDYLSPAIDGTELTAAQLDTADLMVRVALVHATLAAAGPGVEQEHLERQKAAGRAVGAAESQRERQAARPPLPPVVKVRAADDGRLLDRDCNETDHDRYGDCDGVVSVWRLTRETGPWFGLRVGDEIGLCTSHAGQWIRRLGQQRPKPGPPPARRPGGPV